MASSPATAPPPDSSSSSSTPPTPPADDASPPPTPSNSSSSPSPSSPTPSSPPPPSSPLPSSPPPPSSAPPPAQSPPPPSQSPPPPPPSQAPPPANSPPPSPSPTPPPPASPPPPSPNNSTSPSPPLPSNSSSFLPPPPPQPKPSLSPPLPRSASPPAPSLGPPRQNNRDKPSPSTRAQKSPPSSDDGSSGSDTALIIGVVAGVGVFLLIVLISALVCCCKKKNKKKMKMKPAMHYYDPSAPKGGGVGGLPPKWQGAERNNKNIPPPPGMLQIPPGGGGWPPPPPGQYSSEYSSSHSGPQSSSSQPQPQLPPPPSPSLALGFNKSTFTYDELAAATGGFSQGNLLGQGGFGYVFKGYLPNGKEVAVKQLKSGSGQGEREFQAEVEIISRVHHRHLVSLVGYCIAGQQRMLVYEFVPNNTLEHHLHGKGLPTMEWPTRLKIAIGSAKGFAYLHEDCHPRIIHRDIKAANILLDYKFEAMVADFGLAKLSSDTNTHVSTRIMGTFGYLAPEYASSGKLTDRSDVFSFGVMLLELITGRRPIDHTCMDDSLVDWARPVLTEALAEGNFDELADPKLEGNYNTMEMARMVACAAAAVRHSARRRPKMSQIVRTLEGDGSLDDLHEGGVKPGQSMFFSSGSDYDAGSYSNKMRQFRKAALASGEYSGDYSGQTSEYGLNPSESSGSSGEIHSGSRRHRAHQQV